MVLKIKQNKNITRQIGFRITEKQYQQWKTLQVQTDMSMTDIFMAGMQRMFTDIERLIKKEKEKTNNTIR